MPLSAVVTTKALMESWPPGSHGTTFGGNPVSCAAALATLEVFQEERVLDNVRTQGKRALSFLSGLRNKHRLVGDVRGVGLMIGIEIIDPDDGLTPNPQAVEGILRACLERGLILYPCGTHSQCVRFIPPLTVTAAELDEGLAAFEAAVAEVSSGAVERGSKQVSGR